MLDPNRFPKKSVRPNIKWLFFTIEYDLENSSDRKSFKRIKMARREFLNEEVAPIAKLILRDTATKLVQGVE